MIDADAVRAHHFSEVAVEVTERDTILYALGLGLGADPLDPAQLRYTYEAGLEVFPTMPVVLGSPGMWFRTPGLGIDAARVVHAEQTLRNHRPLRVGETLTARNAVAGLADKGAGRGALLTVQRTLSDVAGAVVATVVSTYFLRGDGGFGGPPGDATRPTPMPDRAPDIEAELPTLKQAALIYRLSGDRNPLHADPAFARRAGLDRPILHGLCTFAVAARGLLGAAATLHALSARMVAPVIPGDIIRVRGWREDGGVRFEASAGDKVVLANGHAEIFHHA